MRKINISLEIQAISGCGGNHGERQLRLLSTLLVGGVRTWAKCKLAQNIS